ncbi:MAG TPA: glutamate--tRNA ligase family protein [Gemmatimonadales bacterium]|nr:glutamate--tRNA ligase family protein [Gemmatimonadales bacterium]
MTPTPFRTRFAPSVTGYLHLGHVVNALWVWGWADRHGGEVLIRLEDHDQGRYRPEYERAILDDLEWLGLRDRAIGVERQSDHWERYEAAAASLAARGLTYYCDCTRRQVAEAVEAGEGETLRYPGTCRDKGLGEGPGRALRLRLTAGVERFEDLRLGMQEQDPQAQAGDFALRDGRGQWLYQMCVTVDDLTDGITHVIRGEDLLESTGRQIHLGRLLGRATPAAFLHHPLVRDASGRKLSKKDFAKSLGDLRREGWSPERVLGEAARLGGLGPGPLGAADLRSLFG